jgi:pSer/pThr/pTyr-binding forkhead associated (FHA) protein
MHTQAEAESFHPRLRPAYLQLVIIDDGSDSIGETIRIRSEKLTIGRSSCDLNFPAERLMSSQHCSIELVSRGNDQWQWVIHDLDSRHGLFLRQDEFEVTYGNEWLAGGTKFALCGSSTLNVKLSDRNYVPYSNRQSSSEAGIAVSGYNYTFSRTTKLSRKMTFGTATGEDTSVSDSMVDPNHFGLTYTDKNFWKVSDNKSCNGTWLRVTRISVVAACVFLVGEQRFLLRFDGSNSIGK